MNRIILLMFLLLTSSALTASSLKSEFEQEQVLNGKIGPHQVVMHLDLDHFTIGEVVGYYYYKKRPNNRFTLVVHDYEAINTHGSMNVVLYEYTGKGVPSGTFKGQYECRGDYYEGIFTNSKGKKFKLILE